MMFSLEVIDDIASEGPFKFVINGWKMKKYVSNV